MGKGYTLAEAHQLVRHRTQRRWAPAEPGKPALTTWRVLMHVAKRAGLTVRQLRSSHRDRGRAAARALAARVMRLALGATLAEVARTLGYLDGSSAAAAEARADGVEAAAVVVELAALYEVPA